MGGGRATIFLFFFLNDRDCHRRAIRADAPQCIIYAYPGGTGRGHALLSDLSRSKGKNVENPKGRVIGYSYPLYPKLRNPVHLYRCTPTG